MEMQKEVNILVYAGLILFCVEGNTTRGQYFGLPKTVPKGINKICVEIHIGFLPMHIIFTYLDASVMWHAVFHVIYQMYHNNFPTTLWYMHWLLILWHA